MHYLSNLHRFFSFKTYCIAFLAIFTVQQANAQYIFNTDQLDRCNTAVNYKLFTAEEKLVLQIINLVRCYPKQFSYLYIETRIERWNEDPNTKSLVDELNSMTANKLLYPNDAMQASALCWAVESGTKGIVGHNRLKCGYGYYAECCDYGSNRAIDIVLSLLIDEGVPDLGHRKIILYGEYQDVGISIQSHTKYRNCTVIDFK